MDIIIDGYNLIGGDRGLHGILEPMRNRLIQQLATHKARKDFGIILVFDGWRAGGVDEGEEKSDGIKIVYSRLGEKADSVLVRIARPRRAAAAPR